VVTRILQIVAVLAANAILCCGVAAAISDQSQSADAEVARSGVIVPSDITNDWVATPTAPSNGKDDPTVVADPKCRHYLAFQHARRGTVQATSSLFTNPAKQTLDNQVFVFTSAREASRALRNDARSDVAACLSAGFTRLLHKQVSKAGSIKLQRVCAPSLGDDAVAYIEDVTIPQPGHPTYRDQTGLVVVRVDRALSDFTLVGAPLNDQPREAAIQSSLTRLENALGDTPSVHATC
jgi:hypothetical protein